MKQKVESEQDVASKKCIIADYYANHYDELKEFVISRLQVVDEAEDIVEVIFVRLLQSDQMISPVTLPCLVYTMARNKVIDYWRCRQQHEKYEHPTSRKRAVTRKVPVVVDIVFVGHRIGMPGNNNFVIERVEHWRELHQQSFKERHNLRAAAFKHIAVLVVFNQHA